jgi:Flp pilus assembly protein TadG
MTTISRKVRVMPSRAAARGETPGARSRGAERRTERGAERGSTLVEFALCLPLLVLLFAGLADYAVILQQAMALTQTAAAAAAYGAITGDNVDLTGMQAAAQKACSGLSGLTVTASNIYTCAAGGTQVSSSASCSGYGTPIKYVAIQTSAPVQPLLPLPGFPSTLTLHGSAYYRVPWTP